MDLKIIPPFTIPNSSGNADCIPKEITKIERGNSMNTLAKSKRVFLLSVLCAGLVAMLGGCAEAPYATAYDGGYYYPAAYYTPGYGYYAPTYTRTIVRSGVRYNDAYGPRYYGSTVYGDWY
jgi:hypothetical protein